MRLPGNHRPNAACDHCRQLAAKYGGKAVTSRRLPPTPAGTLPPVTVGMTVQAGDRDNYGRVVRRGNTPGHMLVHFVAADRLSEATVELPTAILRPVQRGRVDVAHLSDVRYEPQFADGAVYGSHIA